jgi:hypothetical protein
MELQESPHRAADEGLDASAWSSDLDDIADLAAELAPPEELDAARVRRASFDGSRVRPLGRGREAAAGGRRRRRVLVAAVAACAVWTAVVSAALLRHGSRPAGAPTAYSTPQAAPTVAAQAAPATGTPQQPVPTPCSGCGGGTLATPAPRAPAPTPVVTAVTPAVAPPPAPRPAPPRPHPAPAVVRPHPAVPPPPPVFAVTAATLQMGTCQDAGSTWTCDFVATFSFRPGAAGTLSWDLVGTEVDCSGTSRQFTSPMPNIAIPAGANQAVEKGYLVFPSGQHPGPASGGRSSTAESRATGPNAVTSAPQEFEGASCS